MKIPSHLAIIMDGNGRWAELRGRERTFGHLRGARVARQIIEKCTELGVQVLTLYAFSTENWFRPIQEVSFLMHLLARYMRKERRTLMKNNIRFSVIGDLSRLPDTVRAEVQKTIEETRSNSGMRLVFALSYGSRQELCSAVKELCEQVKHGSLNPAEIDEALIQSHLETNDLPDPDLIVRTSGEHRLSNFLLWQAAYSELYITDIHWPDFDAQELQKALSFFGSRERRFGRTTAQLKSANPQIEGSATSLRSLVHPSR